MRRDLRTVFSAAHAKQALDPVGLDVSGICSFADFFLIFSGANPRQVQAISDEVAQRLARSGIHAGHVEGYNQAEWVLMDYGDFVVHIFSSRARTYYDLERLWRAGRRFEPEALD